MDRWALLVGINQYPKLPPDRQLHGCVADVELMAGILQSQFGFPKANVTLMRDEQATRDRILAAMQALLARVGQNDVVVLHYSGHGSRMTDREGDEPDGMDETIVPHDSGRGTNPNRDITDDEIYAWLLDLTAKTPFVTLIFDSCHSGTVTRDAFGTSSRWVEPDDRPADQLPESPFRGRDVPTAGKGTGVSDWLPLGERYVLIAGCKSEESSFEHTVRQGGRTLTHGALTYFLCQELVKATPGTTYRDIFEPVSTLVAAAHPRQHPQMEGARDRALFGVRDFEPMRFVPVLKRDGNQLTLAAGAAHGMAARSQWAIYPQATKKVTDETPKLGTVEIAEVRATSSKARILSESQAGAVTANCRAFEVAHFYGEMRLVVSVQTPPTYTPAADELKALVRESDLLRLAKPREPADACAYIIGPRTTAGPRDPVPQLGAIRDATWAVVGQDGRLMMPTHLASEPSATYVLRDNLEKVVRYRQALVLRNPDPDSLLKGKVEFTLLCPGPGGTWVAAKPQDNGGQVVFTEGDRIAFRIVNRHTAPVYVCVLDFDPTGAVLQLYPPEGASELLAAGRTLEVGTRRGERLELYLAEDYPWEPDPAAPGSATGPWGGIETYKLFATSHEADFSLLAQEGYRDLGPWTGSGAGTPLGQLLSMALTGRGTRATRLNRVAPDEEWTTVERSFYLRRKKQGV